MNEQRLETNESPHIMIPECTGQVVVKSWLQTAVSIQGPAFTIDQNQNGVIRLSSQGDLFLAVPGQTRLSLGVVGGDVTLKHLDGGIIGDDLQRNVTLNNVDTVQIDSIGQALTAENLNGRLDVTHVNGDVLLQRVSEVKLAEVGGSTRIEHADGPIELGKIEGKITLKAINGNVLTANALADVVVDNMGGGNTFPAVNGDIWLVGGLRAGEQLFVSERTIYGYWPEDAPLRLFANAPQIDNTVPLSHPIERREGAQLILTGHIEEGKTSLTLKAAQRIALKPLGSEPPRFLPDEFAPPVVLAGELAQKVRTAVHAVLSESAALAGLEERLVTAVVAALADTVPAEVASVETITVTEPVKAESQTHILQLVRDGLITIEQADLLLGALKI